MHPIILRAMMRGGGGGGAPAYNPITALFGAGENGALYDHSDFSTLFQGDLGINPVTVQGQTIGLRLDKSKAMVLGAELVSNGTFDSNTSGWSSVNGAILAAVDGKMRITSQSPSYGAAALSVANTAGVCYAVTFTLEGSVGSSVQMGGKTLLSTAIRSGTYSFTFVATATNSLTILCNSSSGNYVEVDNVSVKVVGGNHSAQPSFAFRPLSAATGVAKWVDYDGVDDSLSTTFASSLGSSCTVARAIVGGAPSILTGQTIGTSFVDSTDSAVLVIVNRALTGPETSELSEWLTTKGATS